MLGGITGGAADCMQNHVQRLYSIMIRLWLNTPVVTEIGWEREHSPEFGKVMDCALRIHSPTNVRMITPARRHRFRAVFSLTFLYPVNSQRLIHQYDKWTYFPPPSPALSLGIGLRQPLYTSWAVTKQAYRSLRLPVQITPWIEEYVEQAVNQRRARERAVEWERYSRSIQSLATSSGSTINPIVLPLALHCSDVRTDVWDPWGLEYSAQNKTIDQW